MNDTVQLEEKAINPEKFRQDLNGLSPLDMSKKLIEYEMHNMSESIEVLDAIHDEYEGGGVVGELVEPVFLNIVDGLIKHPKLGLNKSKGGFSMTKSGLTASRLVKEIKNFDYENPHDGYQRDAILDKNNLDKINHEFSVRQKEKKTTFNRSKMERGTSHKYGNKKDKTRIKERQEEIQAQGRQAIYSDIEVNNKNNKKTLYNRGSRKIKETGEDTLITADVDHMLPLKHVFDVYSQSSLLSMNDLKEVANSDDNLSIISSNLNRSKGDQTYEEYFQKESNTKSHSEGTRENALKAHKKSKAKIEKKLNIKVASKITKGAMLNKHTKRMAKDAGHDSLVDGGNKAIGELIILMLKPVYYEFNDIFKNGIIGEFNVKSNVEAFKIRMNRVKGFVINNAMGQIFDTIKDVLKTFVSFLLNAIVNVFVGVLKKALQIIVEGFTSIVEAFKIISKPKSEMSAAQKGDAIVKMLATTVITFISAYFEEQILGFLAGSPLEFLKDVIIIILSGIASTVVVWSLDQADLFSLKTEKRLARVKEIFKLRVETIKKNTDIFEKSGLEVLAKQKVAFESIKYDMRSSIESGIDVNETVYDLADFLQVDLAVKQTDDFVAMLLSSDTVKI
jgi:hypothetical protein